MTATTQEMIACIEREIKMREYVFPKRVASQQMTQKKMDAEIQTMRDVLAVLQAKAETERLL
jgi:hypothetical protein